MSELNGLYITFFIFLLRKNYPKASGSVTLLNCKENFPYFSEL